NTNSKINPNEVKTFRKMSKTKVTFRFSYRKITKPSIDMLANGICRDASCTKVEYSEVSNNIADIPCENASSRHVRKQDKRIMTVKMDEMRIFLFLPSNS